MSETGEVELRIDQVAPETTAGVDGDLDQCLDHATYDEPFVVDEPGEYTIEYGSIDVAGNIEQWQEVTFTIDLGPCPHPDERETVVIGGLDSGVPNHVLENGCTINDLVLDDQPWDSVGDFVRHVRGLRTS